MTETDDAQNDLPIDLDERNALRACVLSVARRLEDENPELSRELVDLCEADAEELAQLDTVITPDVDGEEMTGFPMPSQARPALPDHLKSIDEALVQAWTAREELAAYLIAGETDPAAARQAFETSLERLGKTLHPTSPNQGN